MGDGYCDDRLNWLVCDFDSGDCCGPEVNSLFCKDCQCLEEELPILKGCFFVDILGNGVCDEFANNEECAFDKGLLF